MHVAASSSELFGYTVVALAMASSRAWSSRSLNMKYGSTCTFSFWHIPLMARNASESGFAVHMLWFPRKALLAFSNYNGP